MFPFAFHWPSNGEEQLTLGDDHVSHTWFQTDQIPESEVAAGVHESLRRVWPEGALGKIEPLVSFCLGEATMEGSKTNARQDAVAAFKVFVETVKEITAGDADEWRRQVRLAAWHVWNHSDESIQGPVLARLLPGLELLEQLLAPQGKDLAPQFEKLAGMALENVAAHLDESFTNTTDIKHLTQQADLFFAGLWAI